MPGIKGVAVTGFSSRDGKRGSKKAKKQGCKEKREGMRGCGGDGVEPLDDDGDENSRPMLA